MRERILLMLLFVVPGLTNSVVWAQGDPASSQASSPSASAPSAAEPQPGTIVPRLVRFSGVVTEPSGKPATGTVAATFSLYELQEGGSPLWAETQNIELDEQGRYTVLLGATLPEGLPLDLFIAGKARWLGVQPQLPGTGEQPRVLLVGMPYALKASDADTLGGKPASAYVLSQDQAGSSSGSATGGKPSAMGSASGHLAQPQKGGAENAQQNDSSSAPLTCGGTPGFIPIWITSTKLCDSIMFQTLGEVGLGTKTPGARLDSYSPTIAVRGTSSGANGTGVFGIASARSGVTNGVFGVTGSSSNGSNGVLGNATATSGVIFGVHGVTASASGTGVLGEATATSGSTIGVNGLSASPNGSGVNGFNSAATGGVGVFGHAAATSGTPAGVTGVIDATAGAGVSGIATGTSGYNNGVYGQTASTSGFGVNGNAIATSGTPVGVNGETSSPDGIGVYGRAQASRGGTGSGGAIAVRADNFATTGNAWGVFATTGTTGIGAAVFGSAYAPSGYADGLGGETDSTSGNGVRGYASTTSGSPVGVAGFVESPSAIAGQFVAHAGSGLILQGLSGSSFAQVFSVDGKGNLDISGNLTVAGSKSARVKLQDGRDVELYAVESPENWFEDFGTGQLRGGVADVALEPGFLQTVDTATDYHVFLTPNGDCHGLYVARKTASGFEVRELGGGTASVAFDYRIVARRRGFETVRLQEAHVPEGPKDMAARLASMRPPEHVAPPAPAALVPPQPPTITAPPTPHPAEPPH